MATTRRACTPLLSMMISSGSMPELSATATGPEARRQAFQMAQNCPEELFGHGGRADFIGVRKAIAARSGGPAQRGQRTGVKMQRITNIVESQGVGDLGVQQRHHVTPG